MLSVCKRAKDSFCQLVIACPVHVQEWRCFGEGRALQDMRNNAFRGVFAFCAGVDVLGIGQGVCRVPCRAQL